MELVAAAGINLDPWQNYVLANSLRRRDEYWAAFDVGVVVPRQNGKNEVILARELAGLFLFGEELIMHTAHEARTANEAFRRLVRVIEANDWLRAELKGKPHWSRGDEGLELKSGSRIQFKTRTAGGGRGFSGSMLVLDEAMILPDAFLQATLPTLTTFPDPQIWFTGSAVDQTVHEHGEVLARIRQRGLAGADDELAYFEWSADFERPDDVTEADAEDERIYAIANPSYGIRVTRKYIDRERGDLSARALATERFGVGDWPDPQVDGAVITVEKWNALVDGDSLPQKPDCFAFDVAPDRSWASLSAAGHRSDGLMHVDLCEHKRGTGWLVDELVALIGKHASASVVCDATGPAGSLLHDLGDAGIEVTPVTSTEHGQACAMLYDGVEQQKLRHLGTAEMLSALRGAVKRPLGDGAWAWSRKSSSVDISPLVACTLAMWGATVTSYKEPFALWR